MSLFSRRTKEDHLVLRYRKKALSYDMNWARYTVGTLFRTLESMALEGDEHLLDISCGTGELERILLPRWPHLRITALDLSTEMLEVAKRKFSRAFALDFLRAHAQYLPFPENSFDIVVNLNAFHYFDNPVETLSEFRRVLVPGGKCVLTDWCTDAWHFKLIDLGMRLFDPTHHRLQGTRQLADAFAAAGFQDLQCDSYRVGWFWGMMTMSGRSPQMPELRPTPARRPELELRRVQIGHSLRSKISSK